MRLRLHRFLPQTRAEGPGVRACLWVQGCPIHCPDCSVPWTWPEDGGFDVDVDDLAGRILGGPSVEGITFLGGEPFAQAEPLALLGSRLQAAGLSVMTFTGYTLEHLRRRPQPGWTELLDVTDLLVDGPFRRQERDFSRPWVGSSNQRFHFLTDRYVYLEADLARIPNRLELRILPDGTVEANGLMAMEKLEKLAIDAGLMLQKADGS